MIDKRSNVAGNIYTEKVEGINVHKYGAHIFRTNFKEVWDYLNQYTIFNRLQTLQWLILKENYIRYHLICIHLTKCGE